MSNQPRHPMLKIMCGVLCALVGQASAEAVLLRTFQAPFPQPGDRFGYAISGTRAQLLVGAPGTAGGQAHLYNLNDDSTPARTLLSHNGSSSISFGSSVAISCLDSMLVTDTGRKNAYYYRNLADPDPWKISETSDPWYSAGTDFGLAVSGTGHFALGQITYGFWGISYCAVVLGWGGPYSIYVPTGKVMELGSSLDLSKSFENPTLGFSCAPVAESWFGREMVYLPVGTDASPSSYNQRLAISTWRRVFVQEHPSTTLRSFQSPMEQQGQDADFGRSLEAYDRYLLIGAPRQNVDSITSAGAVFMFDSETGDLVRTFTEPSPLPGRNFGYDLALLSDAYLAIGSRSQPGTEGKVFVFDLSTGALVDTIPAPSPAYHLFGSTLARCGSNLAVSDPGNHVTPGTVFLFSGPGIETVQQPNLLVQSREIDFGAVPIGETAELTLTLQSVGSAPLMVSGIGGLESSLFGIQSGTAFPLLMESGSTHSVTLRFTPDCCEPAVATLGIISDDPCTPLVHVPLHGHGFCPNIYINTQELNFGSVPVGATSTQSFTVGNYGTGALTISEMYARPYSFGVLSPALPVVLAPGTSTTVEVIFQPVQGGFTPGLLQLFSNDCNQSQTNVLLGGHAFHCYPAGEQNAPASEVDITGSANSIRVKKRRRKASTTSANVSLRIEQWILPLQATARAPVVPGHLVTFYLLDSPNLPCQLPQVSIGTDYVKAGKPGKPGKAAKPVVHRTKLELNPETAAGKYLLAILDEPNLVAEQDEANNSIFIGPLSFP